MKLPSHRRAHPGRPFVVLLLLLAIPFVCLAQEQTWRINLENAGIRGFITQIATITGKTFIVDPRVKGKVTVISNASLDSDAIYELFSSVLRVHGCAAVGTGKTIKIVQQVLARQSGNEGDFSDDVSREQMITRGIPVGNASAIELAKILRPLAPQYGHIAGLTSPNALI